MLVRAIFKLSHSDPQSSRIKTFEATELSQLRCTVDKVDYRRGDFSGPLVDKRNTMGQEHKLSVLVEDPEGHNQE
eukprot:1181118-Amphidinium_carterae.1